MSELAIISLLVSLIFSDLLSLSPGGIIVPFYFVLYFEDPVKIAATYVTALLSVFLIRFLSHFMLLYGRRRFTAYIVVGLLLKMLFTYAYFGGGYMFFHLSMTIGYLVPGILGENMERQGIIKTTAVLTVSVLLIRMIQLFLT